MANRYTRSEKGKWVAGSSRQPQRSATLVRRAPIRIPPSNNAELIKDNKLTLLNPRLSGQKETQLFPNGQLTPGHFSQSVAPNLLMPVINDTLIGKQTYITVIITKGPRGGSITFDLLPEPLKTITNPGLALTNLSIQGLHPRYLLANLWTYRRSRNVERLQDVEVTYDQEDLRVKLSEGGSGNKTAPITPGEPSGSGQRVHASLRLGSPVQVDPKKKQPASSSTKAAAAAKKAPSKRKAPAKTTIPAKRATRPKIARSPRQSARLSKQLTARTANPPRKTLLVWLHLMEVLGMISDNTWRCQV
ncbi:hypothetical protein F2Q70_00009220 [Brassica cretica]|uniref:Uncharacterized protein n=1 Tax=Brassica cretica TaxID=69181 RepID=A0A8S9M4Q0_BRACR|nr:hypothetical protein F2Q70_00009220 [Brassica cretica]